MKIVVNRCYGGFGLSKEAIEFLKSRGVGDDFERDNASLVEAVQILGHRADGSFADLAIVDVPDDVEWKIEEYDGKEWVAEKHRTW